MKERMIDTLHRLIGVPAATALIAEYGGRSLYVPKPAHIMATPGHPLVRLVGMAGAMALAEYAQGQKIDVPTVGIDRTGRARQIVADRLNGLPEDAVARRHSVSPRHVRRIMRIHSDNVRIHGAGMDS